MPGGSAHRAVKGHLHNVVPASFVQMMAVERETCALSLRADGRQGVLFFVAGELYDAILDDLRGEDAAIQILAWDLADVETQGIADSPPRSIKAPLTFVLLEAMRRRDEDGGTPGGHGESFLQVLTRELDGLLGGCLVDIVTGLPLEGHFTAGAAFGAEPVSSVGHELARAALDLVAALGRGSKPEDLVLTFGDLIFFLRFLSPSLLLVLAADPARIGIPSIHATLRRLEPAFAEKLPSWQD